MTFMNKKKRVPALQPVADEVNEELKKYGSIGRGTSPKSNHSTEVYDKTKDKVIEFVEADPEKYEVFYVNNTTPDECFSYMRELPEKQSQISIFDL